MPDQSDADRQDEVSGEGRDCETERRPPLTNHLDAEFEPEPGVRSEDTLAMDEGRATLDDESTGTRG